jgi:NAD(P)-dependent dehydrogenase (short-subunit alcohol dehydrogenase family)
MRGAAMRPEEIDPALFDEIFHLNVLGPIVAMQAVIPLMRAQGGGSIVNINSGTAFMTISSIQRVLGFEAGASWIQPHGARRAGKDRIVVSEIYGDEPRQE